MMASNASRTLADLEVKILSEPRDGSMMLAISFSVSPIFLILMLKLMRCSR